MVISQKIVPKLRFPHFYNGWRVFKLNEISKFYDSQRAPVKSSDRNKRKGIYPYYGASGIIDYIDDYIFNGRYILLAEDGANIVTRSTRVAFIAEGKFWVNNHAHVLKAKGSNYFLCELLELIRFEKYNTGTAQPKLNSDIVKKISLTIPELNEQQKIADFLTAVDEWIENLEKQKEAMEKYKKGMMQKIFSRQIRFKDENGKDFPEWKEIKMEEVATMIMGQSPDSSSYNNVGEGTYLIQGNADILNGISNPKSWTTEPTKVCQCGDILLSVRAPVGAVAKSKHRACIGRGICAIRNNNNSKIEFLFQFLIDFEKRWTKYEQGSTFKAINTKDIAKLKISLPMVEEQQKIAAFLSTVDDLIELKQKQITEAKKWKKGLLQKMFV